MVEKKADQAKMEQLEKKLEEMENRSKRNNIVIGHIPEGAEKDSSCLELVNKILYEHVFTGGDRSNASSLPILNDGKAQHVVHLYQVQFMCICCNTLTRNMFYATLLQS